MPGLKNIDWKYISGGVSMVFSIVFLIISPGWYLVVMCSAYVALFCFIGLAICLVFRKKSWSKVIAYPLGIFLFASFIGVLVANKKSTREEESERVADATYCVAGDFESPHPARSKWLERAFADGHAVFFLIETKKVKNLTKFCSGMVNFAESDRYLASLQQVDTSDLESFPIQTRTVSWNNVEQIDAKYYLSYADGRYLKTGWEQTDGVVLLPESVNKTVEGVRFMNAKDWSRARSCFELADSMGNATGTSILADWYGAGYNDRPDPEKCDSLHLAAAKAGSRRSRYEWSKATLRNPGSSDSDIKLARFFLKKAASLKTIATIPLIESSESAVKLLNQYYRVTGRDFRAYLTTRRYLKHFSNKNIKYREHLDNCSRAGFYREARKIIEEGEKERFPYCYFVHGRWYLSGFHVKKDFDKAEQLFRFAADSLGCHEAYWGMAELCRRADRPDSTLWQALYDVDFTDRIRYEK